MANKSRSEWSVSEIRTIMENYHTKTISELNDMLENKRSDESINAKISRLKKAGKLDGKKDDEVVLRSLKQRRK